MQGAAERKESMWWGRSRWKDKVRVRADPDHDVSKTISKILHGDDEEKTAASERALN